MMEYVGLYLATGTLVATVLIFIIVGIENKKVSPYLDLSVFLLIVMFWPVCLSIFTWVRLDRLFKLWIKALAK